MSQPLLEGRVEKKHSDEDLELINEGLRAQVRQLKEELQIERTKNSGYDQGIRNIRTALGPFYADLKRLFGEMDAIGVGESQTSSPKASAAWDSWKKRLGGKPAEAIDVLLIHGEMTAVQLRLHLHCATDYVYQVISKLNKVDLIEKRDGRIRLKEL